MSRPVGIVASHFTLGEVTLSFEELEQRFGVAEMKKVFAGTGVRNRRIAAPGVCGSDLAFDSAQGLMHHYDIDPASIDLLVLCTQSPDYFLPTTACVLHERLALKRECACFDINLGCSQYIYGLSVVQSMLVTGLASRALLLTGDTMARTIHPKDRAVVPLMGDAGSASLLEPVAEGEGFLGFELGTDGSGHPYLIIPAGGFRTPISAETGMETEDEQGNVRSPENLYMHGAAIFHFAISVVPEVLERLFKKLGLRIEDIDLFLFHQANKYMLEYLFRKLAIPPEKTHLFLEDIGNTSGSTVPLVLTDAWRAGKIWPGSLVLMVAFGVGLSWGATVIRWPENALGPVPMESNTGASLAGEGDENV